MHTQTHTRTCKDEPEEVLNYYQQCIIYTHTSVDEFDENVFNQYFVSISDHLVFIRDNIYADQYEYKSGFGLNSIRNSIQIKKKIRTNTTRR